MARILIAASPDPCRVLERILAQHQFTSAGTPSQAITTLNKVAFDLIVCTVRFDNYKMFDFLRLAKDQKEWEKIPFICAQVMSNAPHMKPASPGTRYIATQLGAAAFLDILDFQENPEHQLRTAIESCLLNNK